MKNATHSHTKALLACLLLAGCSTEIPSWELASFQKQCESRGGIDRLDTFIKNNVRCKDGMLLFSEKPK